MGKQKIVMKVPVNDDKSRSRALRTVVGVPGCSSVSIEGADKNLVVVIGENIDSVVLTKSLRKKVGGAELVTVGPVEEKKATAPAKKPDDKEKKPDNPMIVWAAPPGQFYVQPPPSYYNPDPCTIS